MEMRSAMPKWFIEVGRESRITAEMVRNMFDMNEACRSHNKNLVPVGGDVTSTCIKEEISCIDRSLPWAIRLNPERYPFLVPLCASISGHLRSEKIMPYNIIIMKLSIDRDKKIITS